MEATSFSLLDQIFALLFMLPWLGVETFKEIDRDFWLLFLSMIVPTVFGLIYLSKATKQGEMSEVAPLLIFLPVLIAFTGPWMQDDALSSLAWIGIIIVGVGAYCLKLETVWQPWDPFLRMIREPPARFVWVTIILGVWTTQIQKLMVQGYGADSTLFLTSLGAIFGLVPFIFRSKGAGKNIMREVSQGGYWLIALGLVSCVSGWTQLAAYNHGGHVATVMSIKRLSVILVSFYGIAIMHESLRVGKLLGIILMTVGGAVLYLG